MSFVRTDVRGKTIPNSSELPSENLKHQMLQQVTERRLAEADHRVLHGVCHWTRLARYADRPVISGWNYE